MSDFKSRDVTDLWEEILRRHWTYLETEESIQKLEERKKLEGCLKEFLCIVRHDRKFFLPETALVLKNSIRELNEFNAQKAIGAFESISQYANNLFTKPWRKEFRILKMYSGYFQHEIQSNLIDVEKLFEAMGYRRLSDDTLVLDGPICPDQVTNVSRDAMAAYVELQIMKNIYMALDANDTTTNWIDILRYREKHTGGVSQAINDLAYAVEEKRYRVREKTLAGDNYGYIDVQPSSNYASQLPQCQCGNMQYQIQQTRQRMSNGPCCAHEMQRSHAMMSNMNYSTPSYNHHRHQSGIGNESSGYLPHSRSLEHYNYSDPTNMQQHTMLTHRHSFDHQQQGCTAAHHQHSGHGHQQQRLHNSMQHQQQCYRNPAQHFYEPSYDCIDNNSMGGSSISYAAVAAGGSGASYNINGSAYSNSYNVSGNRIPLPHYISNQLSEYDKTSHTGGMESAYNSDNHMYAQVTKTPQNYIANSSAAMMGGVAGYGVIHTQNKFDPGTLENSTSSSTKDPAQRSHSYLTEHLIDFGDPIIPPPPAEQFDPYHQQYQHHEDVKVKRNNKISENDINMPPGNYNQIRDQSFGNNASDMYVYAKPIPKESRQMHKALHNSMDKSTYVRKNVSYTPAEIMRAGGDSTDFSYESANEDFSLVPRQRSPTQLSKNQEGIGSFDSWNYVFENLDRTAYTKDVGDGENLLVKSLDLDSLNITNDSTTPSQTNMVDKRKSTYRETDSNNQQNTKQKQRLFEPTTKPDVSTTTMGSNINTNNPKPKAQIDNKQKIKPALKQSATIANAPTSSTSTTKQFTNSNKKISNLSKINDNKPKANTNDNNNSLETGGSSKQNKKSMSSTTQNSGKKSSEGSAWSCRFCTFINPDTTRICEICCRTKDNNLNASSSTKATQSINHSAPTCV